MTVASASTRSSDPDGPHQAGVQVTQDMPFIAIHAHAATLAPMAHLGIFDTDAPILGDAFAQVGRASGSRLHILLLHEASPLPGSAAPEDRHCLRGVRPASVPRHPVRSARVSRPALAPAGRPNPGRGRPSNSSHPAEALPLPTRPPPAPAQARRAITPTALRRAWPNRL